MNIRPREDEEPTLNLTPLIDVVFLLLIFFMVTTSFVRDAELQIELPEAGAEAASPQEGIEIVIDADGRYFIDSQELVNNRPDTVRSALRQVAGEQREARLKVRADARASHQSVVTVLDVAGRMGFVNIVIETAQPMDGDE